MITEGAYPFYTGGLSVWCDRIIRVLPEIPFTLMGIVATPQVEVQYVLAPNVVSCRKVPLWGIREALEVETELSLREVRRRRGRTSEAAVSKGLVPAFRSLLLQLYADEGEPDRIGAAIHDLYRFFVEYDFDTAMRSKAA
jgi:hypothetical protein